MFVYFFHCFNNTSLFCVFRHLLANHFSSVICPKTPHPDKTFLFPPFFVILSQIPKQTFELDRLFLIPHLWTFFVNIVDNFVYNFVFHGFSMFFLGITLRFFHSTRLKSFLCFFIARNSFVQFAQKTACQYYLEFFLFSLFSKHFTKGTDKAPDTAMFETHTLFQVIFPKFPAISPLLNYCKANHEVI